MSALYDEIEMYMYGRRSFCGTRKCEYIIIDISDFYHRDIPLLKNTFSINILVTKNIKDNKNTKMVKYKINL